MKNAQALAAITLFFFTATNAHAACSRDDISYYLGEGFTQEQITKICAVATDEAAPSTPAMPEPAANTADTPPVGGNVKDAESYLREVIEGQDIRIDEDFLYYTAKTCVTFGKFNNNKEPWSEEACELVRYKVALRGMIAKRELFNLKLTEPRQIYLEGEIEREFVGELDDYSSGNRRQITKNLQAEEKAIVPFKEGMSADRLLETLNKIAK